MSIIIGIVLILFAIGCLACRFVVAFPFLAICIGVYFVFFAYPNAEKIVQNQSKIIKIETKMKLFKGDRFVYIKTENTFPNAEAVVADDIAVLCGAGKDWTSGVGNQLDEIVVTTTFISVKMNLSYSNIYVREGEPVECYIGTDIHNLLKQ